MFKAIKKIILASASPRRQQYLQDLGVDFTIQTAEIDEEPVTGEAPSVFVQRMAREKVMAIMEQFPDAWVIGADTIVTIDKKILGKPGGMQEAAAMLRFLSGRTHSVLTGFCLGCKEMGVDVCQWVESRVAFSNLSEEMIQAYVATGEPLDKAGSYGIQGKGAFMVENIRGSYSNIVGLPLAELVGVLCQYGVLEAISHADL